MIYTPLTRKALLVAWDAHDGQRDRSGLPYILHPVHLAERMLTEDEVCVALLHDVVEDTDVTLDDLRAKGFPADVIAAVELLTHDDSVPYMDYVRSIKGNPIARRVKLADLEHNSDLSRLNHEPTPRDLARNEKYRQARELLLG